MTPSLSRSVADPCSSPSSVVSLIEQHRLVAILRLDDLSQADRLSRTLLAGGIFVQEYTLTNPDSLRVVERLRRGMEAFAENSAAIGIGSIRNMDEARQAIDSGAQFLVTPIVRLDVIEHCRSQRVPIMCGAMTPTEIDQAWSAGATMVKVFPARQLGHAYIRDVLAPMPYLILMPTGGIDLTNMANYFASGAVAVGIGGQLVDSKLLRNDQWSTIENMARDYATAARRNDGDS